MCSRGILISCKYFPKASAKNKTMMGPMSGSIYGNSHLHTEKDCCERQHLNFIRNCDPLPTIFKSRQSEMEKTHPCEITRAKRKLSADIDMDRFFLPKTKCTRSPNRILCKIRDILRISKSSQWNCVWLKPNLGNMSLYPRHARHASRDLNESEVVLGNPTSPRPDGGGRNTVCLEWIADLPKLRTRAPIYPSRSPPLREKQFL